MAPPTTKKQREEQRRREEAERLLLSGLTTDLERSRECAIDGGLDKRLEAAALELARRSSSPEPVYDRRNNPEWVFEFVLPVKRMDYSMSIDYLLAEGECGEKRFKVSAPLGGLAYVVSVSDEAGTRRYMVRFNDMINRIVDVIDDRIKSTPVRPLVKRRKPVRPLVKRRKKS